MNNQENEEKKATEFNKDIAYIEMGAKDKRPPRKIPVLKIIISVSVFAVLCYLIFLGVLKIIELKNSEGLNKIDSEVAARLKKYPNPLPNTCGEDALMCPSGNVVEKSGLKCEFEACPDTSSDMTKFWKVTNSDEKFTRVYENLDLKYKFSILKNWDFIGKDYGFILYSPNYNCENAVVVSDTSCDGSIIEMISSNTTAESDVEKWYNSNENYFVVNSDNPPPKNYKITQVVEQKAIRVDSIPNNISYYFIYDNTVFALKLVSASDIDYKNSTPFLDSIINSFQFTLEK